MEPAPKKAYLKLITGSVIFGMLGIFVDKLDSMPTISLIFYKQFFGMLALLIFIAGTGKIQQIIPSKKKRYLFLLGMINTATLVAYFICIRYTSFSIAILLLYTAPMYVTLLSPLTLGEKVTKKGIIALLLSLAGLLSIVDPQTVFRDLADTEYIIGIIAGMVSGFAFGCEIMIIRYMKDDYSSIAQLFWYTLIGVIIIFPFGSQVPQAILIDNLGTLLFFGAVNTAFAAVLYVDGISQLKAQTGSIIALIEPVSGIIFDCTVLHTPMSMNTFIGCIFILLGAAMAVLEKNEIRA